MTGEQLYNLYSAKADEYAQLLRTLFIHLGEQLYELLEKAETEGKQLQVNKDNSLHWDGITADDVSIS